MRSTLHGFEQTCAAAERRAAAAEEEAQRQRRCAGRLQDALAAEKAAWTASLRQRELAARAASEADEAAVLRALTSCVEYVPEDESLQALAESFSSNASLSSSGAVSSPEDPPTIRAEASDTSSPRYEVRCLQAQAEGSSRARAAPVRAPTAAAGRPAAPPTNDDEVARALAACSQFLDDGPAMEYLRSPTSAAAAAAPPARQPVADILFSALDANGDGVITRQEMRQGLAIACAGSQGPPQPQVQVQPQIQQRQQPQPQQVQQVQQQPATRLVPAPPEEDDEPPAPRRASRTRQPQRTRPRSQTAPVHQTWLEPERTDSGLSSPSPLRVLRTSSEVESDLAASNQTWQANSYLRKRDFDTSWVRCTLTRV